MRIRQDLIILGYNESNDISNIYCRHRILVRKYYPEQWCNSCEFNKVIGESTFKDMSNECDLIVI